MFTSFPLIIATNTSQVGSNDLLADTDTQTVAAGLLLLVVLVVIDSTGR